MWWYLLTLLPTSITVSACLLHYFLSHPLCTRQHNYKNVVDLLHCPFRSYQQGLHLALHGPHIHSFDKSGWEPTSEYVAGSGGEQLQYVLKRITMDQEATQTLPLKVILLCIASHLSWRRSRQALPSAEQSPSQWQQQVQSEYKLELWVWIITRLDIDWALCATL